MSGIKCNVKVVPCAGHNCVKYLIENSFNRMTFVEKREIIEKGRPTPVLDLVQESKKRRRFFNMSMYKLAWISGCEHLNKFFCWYCVLFSTDSNIWNKSGYTDLNNFDNAINKHDQCHSHLQCTVSFHSFGLMRIESSLSKQFSEHIVRHNSKVDRLIDITLYSGKQELVFRGHDESNTSFNKEIRKEKAKQANSSNCIIPDIQMPFQSIRPQQSYFVNRPPTMWPLRVPLARGLSMNNSVRSLIKPHTNRRVLGSYSTLIQELHTTLPIRQLPPVQLQTPIRQQVPFRPRNPQSNASRPYIVQSSSYAVQSNEPTLMVYSTGDTPQKPSLPKQSQNSQTQGDWAVPSTSSNLYNEEETGDVHDLLEPIAFITVRENPVKAAKRKRSPKKRLTPKKAKNSNKTFEINHGALSDIDNSNPVYFNHFMNGYNSSEAESIVPDLPVD